MTFPLCVVILLDHLDIRLHFFSEPPAPEMEIVSKILSIMLTITVNYCIHVAFLHEDPAFDSWILRHLQLTFLSSFILILIDCMIGYAGPICLGPVDPWEQTPCQAKMPCYWLPASLLENTVHSQQLMTLNIRILQC